MDWPTSFYPQTISYSAPSRADTLNEVKPRLKYARHILLAMSRIVSQLIPIWGLVWVMKAPSRFFENHHISFVGMTLNVLAIACGFALLLATLWIIGYGFYRIIRVLLGLSDPGENEHL